MARKIKVNLATDALLVVDAQPTFMPGGGLAIKDGDKIMPVIWDLMRHFPRDKRFATKDRHPRGHISLASSYVEIPAMTVLVTDMVTHREGACVHSVANGALFSIEDLKDYLDKVGFQVLWPDHAIEGTREAELHPSIPEQMFIYVQVKGMDPKCDSYSGFFDNLKRPTDLADALRERGIRRLICCGLAYDYCVGWTAEGAIAKGFEAVVVMDAAKPVGYPEGNEEKMTRSLQDKGVLLVNSSDITQ